MAQAGGRSPLQMPVPFQRAFQRGELKDIQKAVLECKRLKANGLTYIEQLSMHTAALPYHWEQYPEDMFRFLKQEIVELRIIRLFERENLINWSTGFPALYPIVTSGDGNCLLHAASIYMWGIEDTELVLRECLDDTLNHGSYAAENMKRWQVERAANDSSAMSFEFRYNTGEWGREYEMVKQMASPERSADPTNLPYQSLEEFHIFVLANVLRRPILVISQDKMHSVQGASLQPHPVSGLYLPLNWNPSFCCKFPIVLGYDQNHFFPLLHTAPENEEEEGDLIVPIVKSNSEPVTVHFLLPDEDPMELMKMYLKCESFIHCPYNKQTAVALPGAKLSCDSLGETLSVWEAYFGLAEINQRIYNEEEYNPQPAGQEQDLRGYGNDVGVGSMDHEHFGNNKYPGRDNCRETGKCKTPGCPYQKSVSTGDLCVECFNKGQRVNCQSPDCLNKADVGLGGLCKVCHDGSKFQKSSKMEQKRVTTIQNISNGSSSEEEDRFKTRGDDLNSLAVDTVKTGTDKCIVPECQLTGNPSTGDMCSNCYSENVVLLQQYEETASRQRERRRQDADESEPFVMVNNQGEEVENSVKERQASGGRTNSAIYDRHAELIRKLGLDQDHGATKSAAVGGNVRTREQASGSINSVPTMQGKRMPTVTVQKDLCATPGCAGVRLTKSDLCRLCKDKKRAPRDAVRSAAVPPTSPRQNRGDQQRYHSAYDRVPQKVCHMRVCNKPAAPPDFKFCEQCLEDLSMADVPVNKGSAASAPLGNVSTPSYPGRDADTRRNGNRGGRTSPSYKEQYEATKRGTPLTNNYGGRGQQRRRDDHQFGGNIGSAPPSTTAAPRRRQRDDYRTEDLERQIRDQYVREKSDPTPRNALPPQLRDRIECQRLGGCPDHMFGDPEKDDLCSKCAKEVNVGGQGSKPRSVGSGSYDRGEDVPYLHQYPTERTFPRSAPARPRMVDDFPRQVQQTREHENIYRGGRVKHEIPQEVLDHTYQEIDETCAQPGCNRIPGDNVEGFCDQCHANYRALFADFRQINTPGLHGN